MENENEIELERAYRELADRIRAVMLAGGPTRCNGEWARYVDAKNLVRFLEEQLIYECGNNGKN